MNNWKVWLHGLAAAAIGGAASAGTTYFIAPQVFTFDKAGAVVLAKSLVLGAVLPTLAYLKQSPVPALTVTSTTTKQETVEVTKQ